MSAIHIRTAIADFVLNALLNGGTAAGANVYSDFLYGEHPYPCINVTVPKSRYNDKETGSMSAGETALSGIDEGVHYLVVEALAKNNTSAIGDVNSLAAEIKAIISSDESMGNLTCGIDLVAEDLSVQTFVDVRVVVLAMTFIVFTVTERTDITKTA